MINLLSVALALQGLPAGSPPVQSGAWDITSKMVDLTVPGVPRLFLRMAVGKSKAERKHLAAGQGIEALLAPDPKARCRIESQTVEDGRYAQELACPQTKGGPMRIMRAGSYDTTGFVGQAIVTGMTPKGALRIVLDQRARRAGA